MRASLVIGKFLIGITLPSLLMASAAVASDTMRCGNKLVAEGDTREKVRRLCGEPVDVAYSHILRRPSYVRNGRVIYFGNELIETQVEVWTYNLGPNKLMRRMRFVDDLLEEIDTLGYGYNPPNDD
jgi:Protein of unknown function (DUF2845)